MPYQKNKQQAFQAAQQGVKEVMDIAEAMDETSGDYGQQLKHLKGEVHDANGQITNALIVASETQKDQLREYQQTVQQIEGEIKQ